MLTTESFALYSLLDAAHPSAGPQLAERLGVPKGRIAALIGELENAGIDILRVAGHGYQLAYPWTRLDLAAWHDASLALGALPASTSGSAAKKKAHHQSLQIPPPAPTSNTSKPEADLPPQTLDLEWVEQIDSTSSELMRRVPRHDVHAQALIAEWQSAGRGRRGRPWLGLPGNSLMFSLGWRFEQGAGFLAGLSLAMSVAVARALEKEGFAGVGLKWPNDLIHRYRKLGGILVELNGDALGPSLAVIGVGLNITLPAAARQDISQAVTDLSSLKKDREASGHIDRNRLLARVLFEMATALQVYAQRGFIAFAPEWQRRHAYQDKPVKLLLPDGHTARGNVVGVDASGALVLADDNSKGAPRTRYIAGEISLRRA